MFGATQLATRLGAHPRPDADTDAWLAYARSLAKLGLPVLFVNPGTKVPADLRSAAEKKKAGEDDKGGVHLATTHAPTLKKYLERAYADSPKRGWPTPLAPGEQLNWAVRLRGSGYVVADADTPEEVAALRAFLAPVYGGPQWVPSPTVKTPGTADGAHSDGGHWWFKLPEDQDVPDGMPASIHVDVEGHPAGFSLYTGDAYVLIPPSVRETGAYRLVYSDTDAPMPVLQVLGTTAKVVADRDARREEQAAKREAGDVDPLEDQVTAWSQATPWADILAPHGWVDTMSVDQCGCPVWTAPGVHSSRKSATTHESVCSHAKVDPANPPMHIWTDNPGDELAAVVARTGSKTMSKLTAYAALDHDGDMGAAMRAAGIEQDHSDTMLDPATVPSAEPAADSPVVDQPVEGTALELTPDTAPVVGESDEWRPERVPQDLDVEVLSPNGRDIWTMWNATAPEVDDLVNMPVLAPFGAFKDMPSPTWLIDGLLEDKGLLAVIGDPGVGKSAVVLDMAACVAIGKPWHGRATQKHRVMYVAGEGVSGAKKRLDAWKLAHDDSDELDTELFIVPEAVLFGASGQVWAWLARECRRWGIGLVIFDTLARMSVGLEENSATDMTKGVDVFGKFQRSTGAAVLYVHHTARGTKHGRGSTSLFGAIDSELYVRADREDDRPFTTNKDGVPVDSDGNPLPGKPLTVQVSKQKNGPDDLFDYVCLTPMHESIVVTDITGAPEAAPIVQATAPSLGPAVGPTPQDTAERVQAYLETFTSGQVMPTLTQVVQELTPDPALAQTPKKWRAHVRAAVDYGLSAGSGIGGQPMFYLGKGNHLTCENPDTDW